MGFHTFPVERADALEDVSRYRFLSREELVSALSPDGSETLCDLGSGTGFYTDDLAPFVETVYAIDLQEEMHALYEEKGLPENVGTITADVADLPLSDGECDLAVTVMTYHEFASPASLSEVHRVLAPDGTFVIVDWSRAGSGEDGPAMDERYDATTAGEQLAEAGFAVERSVERVETFLVVARA
ncbi:class I SAM-dependent methyltransferase [Natronorarus salvus]|uniref:class I SAM-dependent methyltransferase n=1 Tax=Natronorarus salvus TaxID=3117733 RepID=UPI002F26A57F